TVHEQAAELAEVGAGIVVAPNMVRLLHKLGLGDALTAFAVRLEAAWEFRSWRDGRVLFVQPMGDECERRYGAHCYVAHRADLVGMLRRSLPRELLHLDHRCVAIRPSDHDVELAFVDRAGGTSVVVTDGVIGADGIHSAVRSMIGPEVMPRFSGLCAFRCLVPAEQAPEMARRPVQTLWLGPGRHFVHYPISGGRLINVVAFAPAGAWRTESWTADGEITDLRAEFTGWDARLDQLITSAASTKRWAIYDRDPLAHWTSGRAALLGDAAHAMLPFFAQGAAQAVEDAAVLAGCLRGADRASLPQALQRYERVRRPRTTQVQLMSRGREVQNHLPAGAEQEARDARLANGQPLLDNAWLYGHDVDADLRST
ncbi:MAG TPA: FAD-dependent monooxygenase, partial [Kofleriaceae bacterium]|nr:FAD-dependent monooxygenase [Kofleriaceae bacterium]